jgi:hypothetical protein
MATNSVVRAFEQTGGRPFTVEHVPEEALRAQRTAANSIDMRSTLKIFPVPRVSVNEYARRITQARG